MHNMLRNCRTIENMFMFQIGKYTFIKKIKKGDFCKKNPI